jgi:hypothetical protein
LGDSKGQSSKYSLMGIYINRLSITGFVRLQIAFIPEKMKD